MLLCLVFGISFFFVHLGRAELRQYRSRVHCGLGGGVRLFLPHRAHLTVVASGPLRQPFLPVTDPAIGAVTLVGIAEHVPAVAVVPCTHPSESPQADGCKILRHLTECLPNSYRCGHSAKHSHRRRCVANGLTRGQRIKMLRGHMTRMGCVT